jgi:hypothetical protein
VIAPPVHAYCCVTALDLSESIELWALLRRRCVSARLSWRESWPRQPRLGHRFAWDIIIRRFSDSSSSRFGRGCAVLAGPIPIWVLVHRRTSSLEKSSYVWRRVRNSILARPRPSALKDARDSSGILSRVEFQSWSMLLPNRRGNPDQRWFDLTANRSVFNRGRLFREYDCGVKQQALRKTDRPVSTPLSIFTIPFRRLRTGASLSLSWRLVEGRSEKVAREGLAAWHLTSQGSTGTAS